MAVKCRHKACRGRILSFQVQMPFLTGIRASDVSNFRCELNSISRMQNCQRRSVSASHQRLHAVRGGQQVYEAHTRTPLALCRVVSSEGMVKGQRATVNGAMNGKFRSERKPALALHQPRLAQPTRLVNSLLSKTSEPNPTEMKGPRVKLSLPRPFQLNLKPNLCSCPQRESFSFNNK